MSENIPVAIAAHLIDARLRADAFMEQHMVLHEAVALLIGHLHQAGAVDADRLAAQLEAAFAAPELVQLAPGGGSKAATLAGRIRGAAHLPASPNGDLPAGS